jgi:hypothetical protein
VDSERLSDPRAKATLKAGQKLLVKVGKKKFVSVVVE